MSAPVLSDAELHHWGEVYRANPALAARGVLFETFLQAPAEILAACMLSAWWPAHRGLLPAQRAVRRWLDNQHQLALIFSQEDRRLACLQLVCRGGRWIERLTHRRHPRNPARRVALPRSARA